MTIVYRKPIGKMLCALFWLPIAPIVLNAAEWKPNLVKTQKNYRGAKDNLTIKIPASVSAAILKTLKIELDNVDITAQIKIVGYTISYKPLQPLSKGFHTVRLVEFAADGNILERGQWKFEVRKSQIFRDSGYSLNTDLSLARNIAQKNADSKSLFRGQGAIAWSSTASNKKWKFTSSANAIYNSQKNLTTYGKRFDLTDYLFTGDAGRIGFKVGHQDVSISNLLIYGFNSRGVSVRRQSTNGRAVMGGFSMRSQNTSGFRNGLGVTRGENRTSGVYAQFFPNKVNPERTNISVAYVDGKCQGTGEALAGGDCQTNLIKQGSGYSVSGDTSSKNTRWRVRGEYASTRFDLDGIGTGFAAENGKAWSLLTVYTAKAKTIGKNSLNWNIALEHKRVGRYFISLTNIGIPRDKLITSAIHTLTYKGINLSTRIGTETDNVDNDPLLPRIRSSIYSMSLNWTPLSSNQDMDISDNKKATKKKKKKFKLFAQPTYTLGYTNTARATKTFPTAFLGIRPEDVTDIILLNANFTPGKWNWSFGHTYTLSKDSSNDLTTNRNNSTSNATNLSITYPITNNLSFGPNVQYNTLENRATRVDENNTTLGFTSTYMWKAKLLGTLTYSYVKNDTSDNSNNSRAHTTDLDVNWILREAKNNRPGVSWFVRGNWNTLDTSANSYQVHTGIRIGWPITR